MKRLLEALERMGSDAVTPEELMLLASDVDGVMLSRFLLPELLHVLHGVASAAHRWLIPVERVRPCAAMVTVPRSSESGDRAESGDRLRFARWLYQNGYLEEHETAPARPVANREGDRKERS
jgi:hypothetical protein